MIFQSFNISLPPGELAGTKLMVECVTENNKTTKTEIRCKRPPWKSAFRLPNKYKPHWTTEDEKNSDEYEEEDDYTIEEDSEFDEEDYDPI